MYDERKKRYGYEANNKRRKSVENENIGIENNQFFF